MEIPTRNLWPQIIVRTFISLLIAIGVLWILRLVFPRLVVFDLLQFLLTILVFLLAFLPLTVQLIRSLTSVNLLCEQRLLYQTLLNKITDLFIGETEVKKIIPGSLTLLGTDLSLSRVLLFRFDTHTNSLVLDHQWTGEDTSPVSKKEQLPLVQYPLLDKWIKEGGPVYTYNTQVLPDQATRSLFKSRSTVSLLSLPLTLANSIYGVLLLESTTPKKFFEEETKVLQSIATVIATTLEKDKSEHTISNLTRLRKKFVETVAHEINTPLSALKHNMDSIMSARLGPLNASQAQILRIIDEIGQNLSASLESLLLMLDFEDGKITLTKSKNSLEKIVNNELSEIKDLYRIKNITLTSRPFKESSSDILIDSTKISLAVRTILNNAATYSPQDTTVETRLEKTGSSLTFTVTDQGIGIPLEDQDKIFFPFFRAGNSYSMLQDSAGIDLFIAKNIIEAHGGHIGFQSSPAVAGQPGKGSTFWFSLPL